MEYPNVKLMFMVNFFEVLMLVQWFGYWSPSKLGSMRMRDAMVQYYQQVDG